ncbi:MAG TPA: hypothetical protein PLV68_05165 [Ilumatobacteraceae bacterium]|nr:hypothetical protein [Ilumatobacteraceae bacterium]
MVAQADFSTSAIQVAPGDTAAVDLTIINLGNRTETFTAVPTGLLAGWVRLDPPTVTLFGGSSQRVSVTLSPPLLATTPAGDAPLTVRVIPQSEPDEVVLAETTASIDAFHDRRLNVLQPARLPKGGEAIPFVSDFFDFSIYEFLVENHGNSQASCRLHLIDDSRRLDGDFDPPAVGVEPGGRSLVRLKLKAVRPQWWRGSRTLPFTIRADQPGYPSTSAEATMVQTPVLPERLGRRTLALVVVAGAGVAGWFAGLKPLVERTARDATAAATPSTVANTGPAVTVTSTAPNTGDNTNTTSTDAPSSTVATVAPIDQVSVNQRLNMKSQKGQLNSAKVTVPPGKEWRISDISLLNSNDDRGKVTVYRNDDELVSWRIERALPNIEAWKLDSPLVLNAGDVIRAELLCDSFGTPLLGQCEDAVYVNGIEIDASSR